MISPVENVWQPMLTNLGLISDTSFSEILSADWRINFVLFFELLATGFKSWFGVFTLLSFSFWSNNDLLARLFELDEWIILLECVEDIKNSEPSSIAPPFD